MKDLRLHVNGKTIYFDNFEEALDALTRAEKWARRGVYPWPTLANRAGQIWEDGQWKY